MHKTLAVVVPLLAWTLPLFAKTAERGQVSFLTSQPSAKDPTDIAVDFIRGEGLKRGLTTADLSDVVLLSRTVSEHNQTTHIHFRQRLGGIEIANADANVNVSRDGLVISMGNRFVPDLSRKASLRTARLSAAEALVLVARDLDLSVTGPLVALESPRGPSRRARFDGNGLSLDPIPAKLAYYALESGEVRLAWEFVLRTPDQQHWWNLWADASSGAVLAKADWIDRDAYGVLALPLENPDDRTGATR